MYTYAFPNVRSCRNRCTVTVKTTTWWFAELRTIETERNVVTGRTTQHLQRLLLWKLSLKTYHQLKANKFHPFVMRNESNIWKAVTRRHYWLTELFQDGLDVTETRDAIPPALVSEVQNYSGFCRLKGCKIGQSSTFIRESPTCLFLIVPSSSLKRAPSSCLVDRWSPRLKIVQSLGSDPFLHEEKGHSSFMVSVGIGSVTGHCCFTWGEKATSQTDNITSGENCLMF